MAHELTMRRNGKAEMAYTGAVPWHGLGQHLAAGATLDTWREAAGMGWDILRAMVRYPANPADAANPATWRAMEDRHVLLRSDTGAALGIVSDQYQEVQPGQVLEFFRDLTEGAGFTMETAGTLFGGRRFWALARVTEDAAIQDGADKVGGFLLLATSADGSMATEARFTTVRVVCNNTLGMARGKAAEVKVSHRTAFCPDAAKRTLGVKGDDVRDRFAAQMEDFRRLARSRKSQADMVRMTLEAFGHDPDVMSRQELAEAAKAPAAAAIGALATSGRGLLGADMAGGSGTAWGWLNAVTQYVDHAARARSQDNRLDSAWFGRGDALKMKAQEVALKHAGGAVTVYASDAPAPDGILGDVLAATIAG
jgi:phage/plasmid-like protein (TIGR03299 family)